MDERNKKLPERHKTLPSPKEATESRTDRLAADVERCKERDEAIKALNRVKEYRDACARRRVEPSSAGLREALGEFDQREHEWKPGDGWPLPPTGDR